MFGTGKGLVEKKAVSKVMNDTEWTVPLFNGEMFKCHFHIISRDSFQFLLKNVRCVLTDDTNNSIVYCGWS